MAKIIYITGASGSGTSTLGKKIKHKYDVNLIESDDITMLPTDPPFQFPRPVEERLELLKAQIEEERLNVIVGSINYWGIEIINRADIFVLLYETFETRKKRILEREKIRFKDQLLNNEIVKNNFIRLIEWTSHYDTFEDPRSWKCHKKLFDEFSRKKFLLTNAPYDKQLEDELDEEINKLIN